MLYIQGGGLDMMDLLFGLPGPQSVLFFLLELPEIARVCDAGDCRDLLARIVAASADVTSTPDFFERAGQSFVRRCQLCCDLRGYSFEQLLLHF
ncbi:hypothetical protein TNCV_1460251 [Trichonephila clavipes]|nr:hypothetical protein TNCV_1460251 [Trichonephila clavipes]